LIAECLVKNTLLVMLCARSVVVETRETVLRTQPLFMLPLDTANCKCASAQCTYLMICRLRQQEMSAGPPTSGAFAVLRSC